MSTVLVLGATSPTAQVFIRLLQQDYPTVNLKFFVRNLKKLPKDLRDYPTIVANADDYSAYVEAVKGVDYIYNAIGGLNTGMATPYLLKAIAETKTPIKHIVDISAGGIYGEFLSGKSPRLSAVRTMYPEYTQDQLNKVQYFEASGIDFTIFRPGLIKNGPETQVITHTPEYRAIGPDEFNINRTTFARAAVNAMFNDAYHNQSVSVSNGAPL